MRHFNCGWLSLLVFLSVAAPRAARADVPALLPLQGYLTDSSDIALDGSYDVTFRLYDAPTMGTKLHEELVQIFATDGYFTAYLGDDSLQPLDLTKLRDASVVFLTIDVDVDDNGSGDGESVPRLQLGANAFAVQAQYCGDAVTVGGKAAADFSDAIHTHDWSDVTGKPATFAPSAHMHPWTEISSKPTTFTPSAHTHSGADIDTGTVGNAYFSSYSDLGAEGYLDNNAAGDLITQTQGDARFAASSHNHGAGAITAGQLDPARYSAYADLTAESYFDNNAVSDILLQGQGDARYAATSHAHNGNDLTSGTVDPARYSAYNDLTTEGYLNGDANTDLVSLGPINSVGTINVASNALEWSRLKNVPVGIADGVDADSGGDVTGLVAGAGISLTNANGPTPTVAIANTALPYVNEINCGSFTAVTATSPTLVKTFNFTAPSAGKLYATLDLVVLNNCVSSAAGAEVHCYSQVGLCTTASASGTCGGSYGYIDGVDYDTDVSSNPYVRRTLTRAIDVAAAGTVSLYLNVSGNPTSSGAIYSSSCHLTGLFVPSGNTLGLAVTTP